MYDPDRSLSVNVSLTCCSLVSSCSPPSNWAIFLPALRLSTVRIPTPSSSVSRTDRTCDWTLWEDPSAREPTMLSISSRNTMEGEHARAWANNWHTERQREMDLSCLKVWGSRAASDKAGRTLRFLIVLYDCCLSDCTNMMIMSHCGISVVINVRLYDSQDAIKTGVREEILSRVLHYQSVIDRFMALDFLAIFVFLLKKCS